MLHRSAHRCSGHLELPDDHPCRPSAMVLPRSWAAWRAAFIATLGGSSIAWRSVSPQSPHVRLQLTLIHKSRAHGPDGAKIFSRVSPSSVHAEKSNQGLWETHGGRVGRESGRGRGNGRSSEWAESSALACVRAGTCPRRELPACHCTRCDRSGGRPLHGR